MQLTERHFRPPSDHYFIFGPRGTGKSTWLRAHLPDAYIVDLLDDATYRQYLSDPDHIKAVVKANPSEAPLLSSSLRNQEGPPPIVGSCLPRGFGEISEP